MWDGLRWSYKHCGPLRVRWHCPLLQLMVPEVLGVQLDTQ